MMTTGEFYERAKTYAMLTNASGTSAGRTEKHNKDVGGVPYSAHRFWLAQDLVYDGPAPPDGDIIAQRLGLKLIREGDHDHLQPLDWVAG